MEDTTVTKGRLRKNKKPIAVVILLILIPTGTIVSINVMYDIIRSNEPEPYSDISHSVTIWIAPEEEEFRLHVDFYGSEQDAYSKTNRYISAHLTVEPLDDDEITIYLWQIPEDITRVWVKIYFDLATEEPNIIGDIEIGKMTTAQLLNREISFLMEPWLDNG